MSKATARRKGLAASRQTEFKPIRLNLNLRVKNNRTGQWTHFKGVSFICEAKNVTQAEAYGEELEATAKQLAVKMGLHIPGATIIYVPGKAADNGTTERAAETNPAETRS